MKGKFRKVLVSVGITAVFSAAAVIPAVADSTGYSADDIWAFRAVANVEGEVYIRSGASEESSIVGYLTTAAAADILERGENWSLVISGGVEGYVKNEFLAFGEDAKNLAGVYGKPGVKTYWDGVSLFAEPSASSQILAAASEGAEYEVVSNDGAWVTVQMDDATLAYVPAEDVKEITILDRAVSTAGGSSYTSGWDGSSSGANTGYDSSYNDSTYSDGYDSSYNDGDYSNGTDGSYDGSYSDGTSGSYDDGSYSEGTGGSYDDESYSDGIGGSYDGSYSDGTSGGYDDSSSSDSIGGSYDDGSAGDNSSGSYDDSASNGGSDSSTSSASPSERELLAGLIYCEAGNQSREGKVAVGAVVMNRIASSSYANSITGVIYESGQFSPAGSGWLDSVISSGSIPSDCYEAADAALAGENPIGSAMYFNTGSGRGVKIGDHQFY